MKGFLKFGFICEVDAGKGLCRVEFQSDGFVSDWLPLLAPATMATKAFFPVDVNEQVVVIFEDERAENGVIVGAIWSADDQPDGGGADKYRVKFSDGAVVEYDRNAHKMTVTVGASEVIVEQGGVQIKRGGESLKAILDDLFAQLLALTVPTSTGPSGTPINAAQITTIKNRLPNLFS